MKYSRLGLLRQCCVQRLDLTVQSLCSPYPTTLQLKKMVKAALMSKVRQATISIVITSEKDTQQLNKSWRGKDCPTNVLSFPLGVTTVYNNPTFDEGYHVVGDIVLCAPLIQKEATQYGQSLLSYYTLLVTHGMLHLQGYDHEDSDAKAKIMRSYEEKILAKCGYCHPWSLR